jgi:hypothetical protein
MFNRFFFSKRFYVFGIFYIYFIKIFVFKHFESISNY